MFEVAYSVCGQLRVIEDRSEVRVELRGQFGWSEMSSGPSRSVEVSVMEHLARTFFRRIAA